MVAKVGKGDWLLEIGDRLLGRGLLTRSPQRSERKIGYWRLGIGYWGLEIGDWRLGIGYWGEDCSREPYYAPNPHRGGASKGARGGRGRGGEFRNSKCGNWKLESVKVRMWEGGGGVGSCEGWGTKVADWSGRY